MKEHDLIDFLVLAAQQGASDLHLTPGAPPMMRVAGVIKPLTEEQRCCLRKIQGDWLSIL